MAAITVVDEQSKLLFGVPKDAPTPRVGEHVVYGGYLREVIGIFHHVNRASMNRLEWETVVTTKAVSRSSTRSD